MRTAFLWVLGAAVLASVGCSNKPRLTLELTTGGEADALSRSPAPTALEVETLDSTGVARALAHSPSPTDSIDLGAIDQGTVLTLRVRGRDATGRAVVFGQTLPVEFDATQDVSLAMFVQRADELARLPGALTVVDPAPLVDRLGGRYVVVAAAQRAEIYDLATFSSRSFALARTPKTIVATASGLLTLDDGGAAMVDPSGASTTVPAPSGGSFADVVGGGVVRGEAGVAYVVGAARAGAVPSSLVLRVADDGTVSFLHLLEPRAGAAATYLPGRGLVVIGGSSTGSGVELLGDGGSVALPFIAVPDANLVAATLDAHRVLVVGAAAPTDAARVVDLACASNCTLSDWGTSVGATPDVLRTKATGLARLVDGSALALADDESGHSHAFRLRESAAPAEVPLRVQHTRARLAVGVGPSVLLVGGAPEIESLVVDPP